MDDSYSFHTEVSPANSKQSIDYEKIRAAVFWLRYISVVYGLLFVGCTVTSAMTTYYASSILTWPFNSVSGIWTGLMAFIIFVFGFRTFRYYDVYDPASSKCSVSIFFTLVIMCITCGALHMSYSAIGFSYCSEGYVMRDIDHCFTDERGRITLTEGFNMMFGALLSLLSIFTTIYISTGRRLRTLTGAAGIEPQSNMNGSCCVIGSGFNEQKY